MNNSDLKNVGIGMLIGAAIGATLGILFAPRSGKETRQMIGEKTVEVVGKAKDKASELRQAVTSKICNNGEKEAS